MKFSKKKLQYQSLPTFSNNNSQMTNGLKLTCSNVENTQQHLNINLKNQMKKQSCRNLNKNSSNGKIEHQSNDWNMLYIKRIGVKFTVRRMVAVDVLKIQDTEISISQTEQKILFIVSLVIMNLFVVLNGKSIQKVQTSFVKLKTYRNGWMLKQKIVQN